MGRPKITIIDDSLPASPSIIAGPVESEINSAKSKIPEKGSQIPDRGQSSQDENSTQIATEPEAPRNDKKKPQKPGKQKKVRGKKYQELVKNLDKSKSYPLNEAVELVKKVSYSKNTGTLEAHINTIQTGIRGLISLPFVSGKKLTILAFGPSAGSGQVKELAEAGVIVGTEEKIEEIGKGKIDFDLVVTTPEWMPKLAKVARILGPRSLMPNPKNNTITTDLKKSIEGFQAGKTEYRTENKAPVIHLSLGKLNQPTEELSANIKTLIQTLGKTRVKKVTLAPTMGPSVKLDLSSL